MSRIGMELLTKLLNMSFAGSAVILLVLVLRLFLKKAPKRYSCALWILVLIRLVWPFTIPSPLSLLPVNVEALVEIPMEEGTIPWLNTGISAIDEPVNLIFLESMMPEPENSVDPAQILGAVTGVVWFGGFVIFVGANLMRFTGMKRRLEDSVPGEEGVYYSDRISMPMVLGFLKPRIYLPSLFLKEDNETEKNFVLSHERCHIKRKDHLVKFAGFAALAVHWFNPLVWLAFVLFCRDLEMACDERVMGELGEGTKKEYSLALLRFSERQSGLFIPLAFGESHTKSRIKNILNYKKPAFWITAAAVLLLGAAAVTLLTDPDGKGIRVIGGADGPTSIFLAGKLGGGNGGGPDMPAGSYGEDDKEEEDDAAAIGIIGGADGPTSIFIAGKDTDGSSVKAEEMDLETAREQPYGMAVELDYVSGEKISMHGSFGYLSFQITQDGDNELYPVLERAVTLSELGGIHMQGDSYTEVFGGDHVALLLPDIYNPEAAVKKMYAYDEKTNTLSGPIDSSEEFWEELVKGWGGKYADAPIEEEYVQELSGKVREEFNSQLLYGPVVVPEYNMNVYGFLAADGENLGDVWYGLWWEGEGLERIVKILLFEE